MSGPVAGLIGGIWAGSVAGFDNVVTLDIGGTSADIGVAAGGQLRMRHLLDTKIGDYQAMVPMVDIDTIGAGGGSIAYVDQGGVFRVGPESAGADPGPACYGRGGTLPTSTDAQLVLGRLRDDRGLLGGAMQLDRDARRAGDRHDRGRARDDRRGGGARRAPDPEVRDDPGDRAQLACAVATTRASSRSSPPAAPGRCSPATSRSSSRSPRVLVPPHPGIIAATGLLATDLQHEFVATERHALEEPRPRTAVGALRRARRGGRWRSSTPTPFPSSGGSCGASPTAGTPARATRCAPRCPRASSTRSGSRSCKERFHAAHEHEYGHRFDAADRDHQHPGSRHRPGRRAGRTCARARRRRPVAREDARARGGLRRRRQCRTASDAVLRAGAAPRRRPDRGAGDRRAVRHDDRDPARSRGRDRPPRQHRDRLHDAAPRSEAARRRSRRRS